MFSFIYVINEQIYRRYIRFILLTEYKKFTIHIITLREFTA